MPEQKTISADNRKVLKKLLLVHGLITFAAVVVLIFVPTAIPKTVAINLDSKQYLLCYFLGAAELSIAFLSFLGRNIQDKQALRIICSAFIVFHIATGVLETFAWVQGVSSKILFNVMLRIVISALFWHYGLYKNEGKLQG